ncbi:MAG TPA: helix-turn-helix transcriptional regulator, partial [Clostridiaceae bacterium]|nr:helix-turn-helix transcriptional regulator [Clostridiaceae bacterium]
SLNGLDMVYNNLLILLNKRCIGTETQVINQNNISELKSHYTFTTNEMKYFIDSISNGYTKESINIMKRVMEYNYRKKINCFQFSSLCYEFINLCIKAVIDARSYLPEEIDIIQVQNVLKSIVCYEDYVQVCENFIEKISSYFVKSEYNDDYVIDYILKYIREKYYEDICLDLFAEKLNLSKVYICKHFKDKVGINLIDYLNKYRMEIACEKLKNTDLKIKDIANEVGIENVNSFIRIFKKYYGISPGEYRTYTAVMSRNT